MGRPKELEFVEHFCASLLKDGEFNIREADVSAPAKAALNDIRVYLTRRQWRKSVLRLGKCITVVGVILTIVWLSVPTAFFEAIFRICLIKMLPFWDWTYLRDAPCWISSPIQHSQQLNNVFPLNDSKPENAPWDIRCSICEDLTSLIERKGGELTAFQVGEDFLVEEMPLIIRNAFLIDEHSAVGKLSRILSLQLDDDTLEPCRFRTNLKTKKAFQFESFLRKSLRSDLQLSWFAFWEFCRHHHVKETRSIIPRPSEFPLMLEVADSVWFFAASNHSAVTYKHVDVSGLAPVFWFTQMLGSSRLRLEPKRSCIEYCHVLEAELQPGDGLLMTTDLFELSWMPGMAEASRSYPEVLAMAAGFR